MILPGYLEGFRLTFNKAPKSGGSPYANIEYVGGESRCPTVAWLLSSKEVERLDRREGAPGDDGTFHYYRIGLPFVTKAGEGGRVSGALLAMLNKSTILECDV